MVAYDGRRTTLLLWAIWAALAFGSAAFNTFLPTLLEQHWVDDVATLARCHDSLERHLPAAAHQAIGAALARSRSSYYPFVRHSAQMSELAVLVHVGELCSY